MPPLEAELTRAILEALRTVAEVRFAMVFGSVAAGSGHSGSDIDLAVDAGRPLSAIEKTRLMAELASRTGRPVDLIDLQTAGEPLLGQIVKHGRRILGGPTQFGDLLRRHLFEKADFVPFRDRILRERRRAWIGN